MMTTQRQVNDLLPGEGIVQMVRRTRVRRECDKCGEPATSRLTYLLENGRRNPQSAAYGRDDCSWCSDHDVHVCDGCAEPFSRHAPDGMRWCGQFPGAAFPHLLLEWREDVLT